MVPSSCLLVALTLPSLTAAYSLATGCSCRCRSAAAAPRAAALHMQMIPGQNKIIDSQDTYNVMMRTLLETNASIPDQISAAYHMVDYAFLQKLETEFTDAEGAKLERLTEIKDAVNTEMRHRVETAAATFKDIVQSPSAIIMEGKIAGLARQGKIDDALMTLLEANIQQAEQARSAPAAASPHHSSAPPLGDPVAPTTVDVGAAPRGNEEGGWLGGGVQAGEAGKGALAVMSKLKSRVQQELDTKQAPVIVLLRRLFRMDSKPARIALLKEKMSPKAACAAPPSSPPVAATARRP